MSTWTFHCSKCGHNFTARVVEGATVKCFRCGNMIEVPVFNELQPIGSPYLSWKIKKWQAYAQCPRCKKVYVAHQDDIGKTALCAECRLEFRLEYKKVITPRIVIAGSLVLLVLANIAIDNYGQAILLGAIAGFIYAGPKRVIETIRNKMH